MRYTTLLFDADGTLLDFKKSEEMALISVFKRYKIPLNDDVKRLYEKINQELWNRFELGAIDKNTVLYTRFVHLFEMLNVQVDGVQFEDDYQEALGQGAYLLEDAFEIVQQLSKTYDLYIVTNGVSKTQYSRLQGTGLQSFMKDIFVSEDIGFQKPQREYFNYVRDHIPSFNKQQTLLIGDSLSSDMLGGMRFGIDTCWYHTDEIKAPKEYTITYEINDLKQLYTIV